MLAAQHAARQGAMPCLKGMLNAEQQSKASCVCLGFLWQVKEELLELLAATCLMVATRGERGSHMPADADFEAVTGLQARPLLPKPP